VAEQLDILAIADEREQAADAVEKRTGNKGLADTIRNADDWWWACACLAVAEIARTGREFTSYQLTQPPYDLAEPDHPNRWGGLMGHMKGRGVVETVGWDNSSRGTSKGSGLRKWRGTAKVREVAA
jgi:hypothetical protein